VIFEAIAECAGRLSAREHQALPGIRVSSPRDDRAVELVVVGISQAVTIMLNPGLRVSLLRQALLFHLFQNGLLSVHI
jgi:hypothetical protein